MDKKKLSKQLAVIALLVVMFAGLDIAIYQLFIKRVTSHHTPGMQKMSVEVADYVPFTDSANVCSADGMARLEGDIPTIDGAAALLPIYAGFVESIYPEDSVIFNGEGYDPASAMHYTNTRGAYKDIVDGTADIIICAQPSDEQLAYAADHFHVHDLARACYRRARRVGDDRFVEHAAVRFIQRHEFALHREVRRLEPDVRE